MIETKCHWCGKTIYRYKGKIRERNFCSHDCQNKWRSKEHNPDGYLKNKNSPFKYLNKELNKTKMTPEVREKLRESRLGKGEGKAYPKTYGRHTHRIVAEQMLGRELRPGEVVHHIDRNKRNNSPENLMVFETQADHFRWHHKHDHEEVMSNANVQTTRLPEILHQSNDYQ